MLVGFATVAAALIARHFDRRKEIEAARREHIGSFYEDLASVYAAQDMTDRKREKMIVGFVRKSLIYASPGTLKAFHEWRIAIPDEDAPRREWHASALRYEAFIKAMRKDLGVSNWMLDDGDLGRVALVDFDEYFGDGSPEALVPPEGDELRVSAAEGRSAGGPGAAPKPLLAPTTAESRGSGPILVSPLDVRHVLLRHHPHSIPLHSVGGWD